MKPSFVQKRSASPKEGCRTVLAGAGVEEVEVSTTARDPAKLSRRSGESLDAADFRMHPGTAIGSTEQTIRFIVANELPSLRVPGERSAELH